MRRFLILLIPIGKWKHKLMDKYLPTEQSVVVGPSTRCLVVGPHPDDETIGCGGIMLKYPNNFDCVVMSSSGLGHTDEEASKMADVRIQEFNKVMKKIAIKHHWIFKTFGVPPMYRQIRRHMRDYIGALDTRKYDYIFLPQPCDGHREHRYITRRIFKHILRKNGYKRGLKICFYGVWTPVEGATYFENTESVNENKKTLLAMYKSQNGAVSYPDMADGLNEYYGALSHANMKYAEGFRVITAWQYLRGKK